MLMRWLRLTASEGEWDLTSRIRVVEFYRVVFERLDSN